MKKITMILTAVLALSAGMNAFAQGKYGADSAECLKYLSYYQEYYKQKNYDSAFPNWRQAMRYCPPTASQNMVGAHGSNLLTRQIAKNARDKAVMNGLVDTLLMLQDIKVQYYPKLKVSSLNSKGQYLVKYRGKDKENLNKELLAIVGELGEKSNKSILFNTLESSIDLFKMGSRDAEEVLDVYEKVIDCIENAPAKDSAARAENAKTKSDIEAIFAQSNVASCEDIIRIFTPKLDDDPENIALSGTILKLMNSTDGCSSNDLYMRAVTTLHNNAPTSKTAYGLYRLNVAADNTDKAIEYLEEAIARCEEDEQAAKYNYELAILCYQNNARAKAYAAAGKAAALGYGYTGKAYLLMGDIWKSTSCGGNEVTRYAHFWAAQDFYSMARNADPSLANEVSAHSSGIGYPSAADAFMYGISNGQSYTVSCGGISKSTTVRLR